MAQQKHRTIDSVEQLQQDLAKRHQTLPTNTADELKPLIAADREVLLREGYIVLEGLLDEDTVATIRSFMMTAVEHTGRNTFEGVKTQRLYNVLEKTRLVDALAIHPRVTGLLDTLFKPNYLLSQVQGINILPGEKAQPLHYDDGFYPVPRPRAPFGAATIWAIDEFTEDNGSTVVLPRSHTLGDEIVSNREHCIPVTMAAGSVVIFLGTLWHGGGENRSSDSRLAVTCQYCEPWLRPQENFFLELSAASLQAMPERLLSMVGYSIHPPFMGMVNGMHPKRNLK